jgi:[ribosomal protein S5]-alanine N-acetyltransferase
MRMEITIEPIALEHADAIQRLAGDPAISEMTRVPSPYPPGGAASFIANSIEGRNQGTDLVFVIKHWSVIVGACGLHDRDKSANCFELGYWVGKPYWGKGIATEAISRLMVYCFKSLHLSMVYADCLERNAASKRVLEENGFSVVSRRQNTDPKWKPDDVKIRYERSMI